MTLTQLDNLHSWRLERLSPTACPQDITVKLMMITPADAAAIESLMKLGSCYRFRIAKGRWHFGKTMEEAIAAALKGENKR